MLMYAFSASNYPSANSKEKPVLYIQKTWPHRLKVDSKNMAAGKLGNPTKEKLTRSPCDIAAG